MLNVRFHNFYMYNALETLCRVLYDIKIRNKEAGTHSLSSSLNGVITKKPDAV